VTYTLIHNSDNSIDTGSVILDADGSTILNWQPEWQTYRAWLADGNTPTTPPPIPQPMPVDFLQFMSLLTEQEQAALISSNDIQTKLFVAEAEGAGTIDLADPLVVQAVEYVASLGLISPSRVSAILNNQPPS